MGSKGEETRKFILEKAKDLFADKGFTKVTMKDICEATGLSRGGLYRHFASTDEIFETLFLELSKDSNDWITEKIQQGESALSILDQALTGLVAEMKDCKASLSLAIYEYAASKNPVFFDKLNHMGREKWEHLLQYGQEHGEFKFENAEPIIDLLLYSYQGVRMWSRIIRIEEQQIEDMVLKVRHLIIID